MNLTIVLHISSDWTLGSKPSERVVLRHLNLEMSYRLKMILSCDKGSLPRKTALLNTGIFCLQRSPAFCFERICRCCAPQKTVLQFLILICPFSRVSSFVVFLYIRNWNDNLHHNLTLSNWVTVFRRVFLSALTFRLYGTDSMIWIPPGMHLWTESGKKTVLAALKILVFPSGSAEQN